MYNANFFFVTICQIHTVVVLNRILLKNLKRAGLFAVKWVIIYFNEL